MNPIHMESLVPFELTGIILSRYNTNNSLAVLLQALYEDKMEEGMEEGMEEIFLSVNIVGISEHLPKDQFCAKNWSEHEKLYKEMIRHGLIEETGQEVPTGFVKAPVVRLTNKGKELVKVS